MNFSPNSIQFQHRTQVCLLTVDYENVTSFIIFGKLNETSHNTGLQI